MERKEGYVTKNAKKAIAKVRKEFAPKTLTETISEAMEKAVDVASNVFSNTRNLIHSAEAKHNVDLLEYCTEGPGAEAYMNYLHSINDTGKIEKMYKLDEMRADKQIIEGIKAKIRTEHTALVVLDEGKYLVKILNDTQIYSDTTLPENLRGKLGLLKLVEPKQFISNTGFRASDEIFIIDLAQA
jgi:hypothetical protein